MDQLKWQKKALREDTDLTERLKKRLNYRTLPITIPTPRKKEQSKKVSGNQ